MRLLDVRTLQLKSFLGKPEPYAILSHRWGEEEVLFSDLADLEKARTYKGFSKVEKSCEQAIKDGFDYIWIDTCCIEKSSSAELSEAINSMFAWYKESDKCYAYLDDVKSDASNLAESKWFTRSWTLQELVAPRSHQGSGQSGMVFFSSDWHIIGDKAGLSDDIAVITGIDKEYLLGKSLDEASISMRMSWAAERRATRAEDIAYSLLGVFDVNMPLLYGEGKVKAFRRLQEEIMKISEDETLFAWDSTESTAKEGSIGVLATEPKEFRGARHLVPWVSDEPVPPHTMTHRGLRIWLQRFNFYGERDYLAKANEERTLFQTMVTSHSRISDFLSTDWAILQCQVPHDFDHAVMIPLQYAITNVYTRNPKAQVVLFPYKACQLVKKARCEELYIRNVWSISMINSAWRHSGILVRTLPEGFVVTQAAPAGVWKAEDRTLRYPLYNRSGTWVSVELNVSPGTFTPGGHIFLKFYWIPTYPESMRCDSDNKIWQHTEGDLTEFHSYESRNHPQSMVSRFHDESKGRDCFKLDVGIKPEIIHGQPMFAVDVRYTPIAGTMSSLYGKLRKRL